MGKLTYQPAKMNELKSIGGSLSVQPHPTSKGIIILCDYPFLGDVSQLYLPAMSNRKGAMRTTASLFAKLHKRGLASKFHDEIEKSINDGHIEILTSQRESEILSQSHCFAFLNYAKKASSSSQKIRPVSNTSAPHESGSINSRLPKGPNMIGNIRSIF